MRRDKRYFRNAQFDKNIVNINESDIHFLRQKLRKRSANSRIWVLVGKTRGEGKRMTKETRFRERVNLVVAQLR